MAIDPNEWLVEFSKRLTPDDTVVCDAGSSYYLCHQRLKLPDGCRLITDLAQGAMGFAIPAAIGVALAKDKGRVYVITGDGSYRFMEHNIYTILAEHIKNISIFVLVNGGYKTIRDSQVTWCGGREVGLQSKCTTYPWFSDERRLVDVLHCGDYEVRRPVVG